MVNVDILATTPSELWTTTGQFMDVIPPAEEADREIVLPMDLNQLLAHVPLSRVPMDDTNQIEQYRQAHTTLFQGSVKAGSGDANKFKEAEKAVVYEPVRGADWTVCTNKAGELIRVPDSECARLRLDDGEFLNSAVLRVLAANVVNHSIMAEPAAPFINGTGTGTSTVYVNPADKKTCQCVVRFPTTGAFDSSFLGEEIRFSIDFSNIDNKNKYLAATIADNVPANTDCQEYDGSPSNTPISIDYPSPHFFYEVYSKAGSSLNTDVDNMSVIAKYDAATDSATQTVFQIEQKSPTWSSTVGFGLDSQLLTVMTHTQAIPDPLVSYLSCDEFGDDVADGAAKEFKDISENQLTLERTRPVFTSIANIGTDLEAELDQFNRMKVVADAKLADTTDRIYAPEVGTFYVHPLLRYMTRSGKSVQDPFQFVGAGVGFCLPIQLKDFMYSSDVQMASRPVFRSRDYLDGCALEDVAATNITPYQGENIAETLNLDSEFLLGATRDGVPGPDRKKLERALDEFKYGYEVNRGLKRMQADKTFNWSSTRENTDSEEYSPLSFHVAEAIKALFKVDEDERLNLRFNYDKVSGYIVSKDVCHLSCGVFTGKQMAEILESCIQAGRHIEDAGVTDLHECHRLRLNQDDKVGVTVRLNGSKDGSVDATQSLTIRIWLKQDSIATGPNNTYVSGYNPISDAFGSVWDTSEGETSTYAALKQSITGSLEEITGQTVLHGIASVHGTEYALQEADAALAAARGGN
jgi:hypothetical protein